MWSDDGQGGWDETCERQKWRIEFREYSKNMTQEDSNGSMPLLYEYYQDATGNAKVR